ncbi:MAG: GatB/YqeY domain-containing protein [Patescibacteria group bacterium]
MLLDRIQEELKSAMKSKNEKETSVLRGLVAAVKNEEIAKRPKTLEEADVAAVIKREIKKLKDGIEQFNQGGRADLAESYESEIIILSKYLPEEASEDKIRKIVKEKIANSSDKNFGIIMKQVMAELKGTADGSLVSKITKEELENS